MRSAFLPYAALFASVTSCAVKPPEPPAPRIATPVTASQGKTWDAVIDVFAERNIPIRTMERASGFISTEQLGVSDPERQEWADCGKANFSTGTRVTREGKKVKDYRLPANRAIYNVLVRGDSAQSTVKTTVRWTRSGEKGVIGECSTTGIWESEAEAHIKQLAEASSVPTPAAAPTASPADIPPGTNWVADTKTQTYYRVNCPAVASVAPVDRLFYATENALQAAGFKRAESC